MSRSINIPTISDLPHRNDMFSIVSYPKFSETNSAVDVKWDGKRYIVMRPPYQSGLHIEDHSYITPSYLEVTVDNTDYVAVEIPDDAIFLGSIDLSMNGVGIDPTQQIFLINVIIDRLGRKRLADWQNQYDVEFPLAYSNSTGLLYGIIN